MKNVVVACDLGASSGRLFYSYFENKKIILSEIHRFPNEPIKENGKLVWDIKKILNEIEIGIKKIVEKNFKIESIGFDTWGVDYGWLKKDGELLENPRCYRDSGDKWLELEKKISKFEIFEEGGVNFFEFNSLYRINKDKFVERDELLFLPNLIGYFLTNKKAIEYSIGTTSGLVDQREKKYSEKILDKISLKFEELPELVSAGTVLGEITEEKRTLYNVENNFKVINVNCHDTGSAVYSMNLEENTGFIVLGTWSIIGVVRENPILTKEAFELGITNEGVSGNQTRVQHLIPGMWILQRLKKDFEKENKNYSYSEINELAIKSKAKESLNLEDEGLVYPESMVEAMKKLLPEKNYEDGDLLKIAYNSIVSKVKKGIENLEIILDHKIEKVVAIGGGIQDKYLIERLSGELKSDLSKGFIEASVIGNLKSQYVANKIITEEMWKDIKIEEIKGE